MALWVTEWTPGHGWQLCTDVAPASCRAAALVPARRSKNRAKGRVNKPLGYDRNTAFIRTHSWLDACAATSCVVFVPTVTRIEAGASLLVFKESKEQHGPVWKRRKVPVRSKDSHGLMFEYDCLLCCAPSLPGSTQRLSDSTSAAWWLLLTRKWCLFRFELV